MTGLMSLFQGSNLVFCIIFAGVGIALRVRRVPWSAWGGPFVSIGILGTFYGILVALLGFDVGNIESSVPKLIDGMKTAFATSVVGVTVSIATRLWDLLRPSPDGPRAPRAEDYLALMRAQVEAMEAIQDGIGGEQDSSLLVQVQKLRLDMADFMKKLSTQSTDAIVEALREVIRDFNARINEQFGDNFKQLNEAVGRLVGWMEQHRALVTASHEQLRAAEAAMQRAAGLMGIAGDTFRTVAAELEKIRVTLAQTAQTTAQVPASLDQIGRSLGALQGDARTFHEQVAALGKAVETLTLANTTLAEAMRQWGEVAREAPQAGAALREMVEGVRTHAEAVTRQHQALAEDLQRRVEELSQALLRAQQGLVRALQQSMELEVRRLADALQRSHTAQVEQMQKALAESGARNQQQIEAQIKALDEALGRELEAALKQITGKLASLSQAFVSDYAPLTDQLRQVVLLAKKIEAQPAAGARHG